MRLLAAVLLVAVLCPSRRASAEERYFALFFAHQTPDTRAEEAHTYIEFIRGVSAELPASRGAARHDQLASSQHDRPPLRASTGAGSQLYAGRNSRTSAREKHLRLGSLRDDLQGVSIRASRKAQLESGAIMYKAIDVIPGQSRYSANCIHGAAEIDPDARRIGQYNVKYGEFATKQAIRHYVSQGFLINPCLSYDDIYDQLGLEGRCINRRNDWEPNLVIRTLRPKLHCD